MPHSVMLYSGTRQALQRGSWLAYSPPTPNKPNQPTSTRAVSSVNAQGLGADEHEKRQSYTDHARGHKC